MIEPTEEMVDAAYAAWAETMALNNFGAPIERFRGMTASRTAARAALAAALPIVERDQRRFRIQAIVTSGPDLSIQCTACHRWSAHIDRPLTLAELNQRVRDHAEACPS